MQKGEEKEIKKLQKGIKEFRNAVVEYKLEWNESEAMKIVKYKVCVCAHMRTHMPWGFYVATGATSLTEV